EIASLTSMPRMTVADDEQGIESISWDYDRGKPIDQVTVQAWAKDWQAPPRAGAVLEQQGPADGEYFVTDIDADLGKQNSLCDITLKRPAAPLPEPASSDAAGGTRSKRVPARGGTNGKAQPVFDRINQLNAWHIPYRMGGGH